ncbi:MAG TPA: hypothetical protein VK169_10960 [Saprospiraceae bacterium]|nr:hypothetical protein [Saprospiraceae bacterium]
MSEKYSLHTFMFPFRWDYVSSDKPKENDSYSKRTKLSDFDRVFTTCETLKRNEFKIELDNENFNEYTYFHEYARKALYDIGNVNNTPDKNEVLYYDKDGIPGDILSIEIKDGKQYDLFPDNICLHIYSTGIGILSYNLSNYKYNNEEDILNINEFGRRIYPQFLAMNDVKMTKDSFLANKISGNIGHIAFEEDFNQYKNSIELESTFLPPDHIKKIFGYKGQENESTNQAFVFRKSHERKGNIRISKLTDDRMFFLSYFKSAEKVNKLAKPISGNNEKIEYEYLTDGFWYAYVFGDKNKNDITVKNVNFQKEEIRRLTYDRWLDQKNIDIKNHIKDNDQKDGVLYGMSRDSFVCVGSWFLLPIHMTTMYYQMAILCLAQRASVLRFSYEVSLITDQLEENKDATRDIKDLYKNYIQFINKIYFREVTPQLQGIEMYNQFQDVMGLEKDVKDLDNEIRELHTYISMVEQSNLSKVAVWFLPAGVLVGILGMNTFAEGTFRFETNDIDWLSIGWIVAVILFSGLFTLAMIQYFNRKTR